MRKWPGGLMGGCRRYVDKIKLSAPCGNGQFHVIFK